MVTSFLQYLLMAPSFTNIINVFVPFPLLSPSLALTHYSFLHSYAFCNVNDVTWGNRPEEKQQNDLGAAPAKEGGVDVAVPTDEKDMYVFLPLFSSLLSLLAVVRPSSSFH
jgi:chitin synthase